MFDWDRWQEIGVTITRNKVRSILTGFGVFWGIFMLIAMMGFGSGMHNGIMKGIKGFATNSCFMFTRQTSLPYKGFQKGRQWHIHNRDVAMLLHAIPEIDVLSPVIFGEDSQKNNIVVDDQSGTFNVRGLYPNYEKIENQFLSQGRFINDIDIQQKRKVCVIGSKVYEELFPSKINPIGQYIRVNGIYFQVVGIAAGVSNMSLNGKTSEAVSVPFTTLQQINNQGDVIDLLAMTAQPRASVKNMETRMNELVKVANDVDPADEQALMSFNMEENFKMFNGLMIGIVILIWIVGSGTLIAGIVGDSNIMVVTVKERTKEIGVRRALGAKPRTIMSQILMESLILTTVSGLLGLCLGVLTLHLSDRYWLQDAENIFMTEPMVPFGAAIVSTVILLICGLIAGAIPTMRALRIKAIDAIREE
ncbi:MAG: ABC transporter permease [Dysgonamonadaceae bacterium]|nr:ABC transporter permease [Dysgonamonadaceae bacterium]